MRALAFLTVLAVASTAFAGDESWRQELERDLVTVKDGKLVYDRLILCQLVPPPETGLQPGRKFQVKSYSEAPAAGVISRDQFVVLTTQMETRMGLAVAEAAAGLTPSQAIDAFDCQELSAPIGRVDLKLRLVMTADGVQTELETPDGQVTRSTETWQSVFAD